MPDSDSRPGCSAYSWTTEGQASSCFWSPPSRRRAGRVEQRGNAALLVLAEPSASSSRPLHPPGLVDQLVGAGVVAADGLGDLGQVADPVGRDHLADLRGVPHVDAGEGAVLEVQAVLAQQPREVLVERGDAVVVERRGAGAEDRHVLGPLAERLAVADQLAADVAHRVLGAAALELVDRDDVGEVEHVDLLELAGRAELRRHDVQGGVDERHHGRVALADAGRLDDDQVEAGRLEHGDDVAEVVGQLVRAAGGERAEVDAVAVEGVHPDPVAEQRAAALAPGRVDRDDRDAELVLLVDAEPAYELVGEAGLAGAAGAGDAEHRDLVLGRGLGEGVQRVLRELALLDAGDRPRDRDPVAADDVVRRHLALVPEVEVEVGDDAVDHPGEAEPLAVLGGEDGDAAGAQPVDLVVHDHAATAADDVHVVRAALAQRLDEVLEVLDVAALVRRHRDALDVLLDRGVHDLLHRAVVPEVHDLAPLAHEDPPHDVDRRVVPVEQAGRGDQATGCLGTWSSLMCLDLS